MRLYYLLDVNNAFATWEQIFSPGLKGKPLAISGVNNGNIIARSDAAKKLGVKMGQPVFEVREFVARRQLVVMQANYPLYLAQHERFVNTLSFEFPEIFPYSIDEVFSITDIAMNPGDADAFAREVQASVYRQLRLSIGIGIGTTPTIAKLGSYWAKKHKRSTGCVLELTDSKRLSNALKLTPTEEVWGIGRRIASRLKVMGIESAWDFASANPALIRKNFGVTLLRTQMELNGTACIDVRDTTAGKQQIVRSRSFGEKVKTKEKLSEAVAFQAERLGEELRLQKQFAGRVGVFIRCSPFAKNQPFYANNASRQLILPSQDTRDIIRHALSCLDDIYRDGFSYASAGVMAFDLTTNSVCQFELFAEGGPRKHSEELMSTIDRINYSGKGQLWFAGQGMQNQERTWRPKSVNMSPGYMNNWNEILKVRIG